MDYYIISYELIYNLKQSKFKYILSIIYSIHAHSSIMTYNYNNLSYIYYIWKKIFLHIFKYLRCFHFKVKNNTIKKNKNKVIRVYMSRIEFIRIIWAKSSLYKFDSLNKKAQIFVSTQFI